MQTTYLSRPEEALEGMLYDASGSAKDNQTLIATLTIPYGRAVAGISGSDVGAKLPDASNADIRGVSVLLHNNLNGQYVDKDALAPYSKCGVWVRVEEAVTPLSSVYVRYDGKKQTQTLVLGGDLTAGDTFAATVNGVAVSVAFNTDQATTSASIEAALEAIAGVESANRSNSNHTFTIISDTKGENVTIVGAAVTGGSAPTVTITETVASIPLTDRGKFRASADSSTAMAISSGMRYASTAAAGQLARLIVNLPS